MDIRPIASVSSHPSGRTRSPRESRTPIMTSPSFQELPLAPCLQKTLEQKGYHHPSPVQSESIPPILNGEDLLAVAQTGTGKTASFALPVLHRLHCENRKAYPGEVRNLVLTPTRELAVQIAASFRVYGAQIRFRCALVHGGVSQKPQEQRLRNGVDVLVACPGRLLDLLRQGIADLSEVQCLVLDEADRMLDMGFLPEVRKIAKHLPARRQGLLFSATMPPAIAELAQSLLDQPREIRITPERKTADRLQHSVRFLDRSHKFTALTGLLLQNHTDRCLVFSKTKHGTGRLAERLSKAGIQSEAIHGNKSQSARQKSLERFRSGKVPVLVATDVAARGIDVKDIGLVVNFDLPMEAENYVHRIGRTARAGASGKAVSLCSREEIPLLQDVERALGADLPEDFAHEHRCEQTARARKKTRASKDTRPKRHNRRSSRARTQGTRTKRR